MGLRAYRDCRVEGSRAEGSLELEKSLHLEELYPTPKLQGVLRLTQQLGSYHFKLIELFNCFLKTLCICITGKN